jgi:hypothetical protein
MPRQSSHTVTYKGLLAWAEKQAAYARRRKDMAPGKGITNLEALVQDVAYAETLVRMLKKGLPGKQTDFMALFNEVNK